MKIRFADTLTSRDTHRHIPHYFHVPEGTTRLHVEFSYEPRFSAGQSNHNQMSLSLADPAGPRGVYYLFREYGITIDEVQPTPGFNAGPVRPGTWLIEVDTYRLLPPDDIRYVIDVELSSEPIDGPPVVYRRPERASRGPGWYRGDLHSHSLHSDASWDVPDLVAFARRRGLDFVTLTDHNTVSGLPQHESLATNDLLTMGGLELTTYYGHAVVLGTRRWFEWRLDTPERHTMRELAQQVLDAGAFFVTAHPMSPGDPECSGCHWEFQDMRPGNSQAVEVWNGGWGRYNEMSLQLYYSWLNEGHRLVATAGSDLHGDPGERWPRWGVNVVYAEDLTEEAVLAGLRNGHSYISSGPELLLTGRARDAAGAEVRAMCGDTLPAFGAGVEARWSGAGEGDRVRLVVDGAVVEEVPAGRDGSRAWQVGERASWCTVELRDASGELHAVSNPIYLVRAAGRAEAGAS
ncbi:MAG TPA: CehA/McbA family metallohydrolase [Trueperaceae bacterium]